MPVVDRVVGGLLVFVSAIGPWTKDVGRLFALSEFETQSVIDMAWFMFKKIPISFLYGFPYFVGVPLVLIIVRYFFPRLAGVIQTFLIWLSCVASVVTLPLLCISYRPRDEPNIMGDVFAADMIVMWVWHAILCLYDEYLPPSSLVGGPLLGLAIYLRKPPPRPSSIIGGIAALYACIGSLYAGYMKSEQLGLNVFSQTVAADEWYGYEMYALVTIVGGFILICASIPPPRSMPELFETVLYIILTNANVAAGWVASAGVLRPPLVSSPRVVVFRW